MTDLRLVIAPGPAKSSVEQRPQTALPAGPLSTPAACQHDVPIEPVAGSGIIGQIRGPRQAAWPHRLEGFRGNTNIGAGCDRRNGVVSWWGKVVGGAFGFMLLGPLGALLGAALGHKFDSGLAALEQQGHAEIGGWSTRERVQTAFFTATFAVMGHVAKADGRVTHDEVGVANELMRRMGLEPQQRELAQNLFREGKSSGFDLDAVLDQLRDECRGRPDLIQIFLEVQCSAAHVDGSIHRGEREVLERIRRRLRVRPVDFQRIEALVAAQFEHMRSGGDASTTSVEDAYAVLGVATDAGDDEVKRAYRRLMSRHHPDKLVAQGLPEEMVAVATERAKEISIAWERVRETRGIV